MGLKTLFGKRRPSTLVFSEKLVYARIFGAATRQSDASPVAGISI